MRWSWSWARKNCISEPVRKIPFSTKPFQIHGSSYPAKRERKKKKRKKKKKVDYFPSPIRNPIGTVGSFHHFSPLRCTSTHTLLLTSCGFSVQWRLRMDLDCVQMSYPWKRPEWGTIPTPIPTSASPPQDHLGIGSFLWIDAARSEVPQNPCGLCRINCSFSYRARTCDLHHICVAHGKTEKKSRIRI